MRKVTATIIRAFLDGTPRTLGNSSTDGLALFLHGNKIAEKRADGMYITNAGWRSNVTKERLNAIPNVWLFQKAGVWYLGRENPRAWDGSWIKV